MTAWGAAAFGSLTEGRRIVGIVVAAIAVQLVINGLTSLTNLTIR